MMTQVSWLLKRGTHEVFQRTAILAENPDMIAISAEEAAEHRELLNEEREAYTQMARDKKEKDRQGPAEVKRSTLPAVDKAVTLEAMTVPELRQLARDKNIFLPDEVKEPAGLAEIIKNAIRTEGTVAEQDVDPRLADFQDDLTNMKRSALAEVIQKENLNLKFYGSSDFIRNRIRAERKKIAAENKAQAETIAVAIPVQ